jgi:hypothetical protein
MMVKLLLLASFGTLSILLGSYTTAYDTIIILPGIITSNPSYKY